MGLRSSPANIRALFNLQKKNNRKFVQLFPYARALRVCLRNSYSFVCTLLRGRCREQRDSWRALLGTLYSAELLTFLLHINVWPSKPCDMVARRTCLSPVVWHVLHHGTSTRLYLYTCLTLYIYKTLRPFQGEEKVLIFRRKLFFHVR